MRLLGKVVEDMKFRDCFSFRIIGVQHQRDLETDIVMALGYTYYSSLPNCFCYQQ
jgi:hypothetical protein